MLGASVGAVLLVVLVITLGFKDGLDTSSALNINVNGTGAAVIFSVGCAVIGTVLLISSRK